MPTGGPRVQQLAQRAVRKQGGTGHVPPMAMPDATHGSSSRLRPTHHRGRVRDPNPIEDKSLDRLAVVTEDHPRALLWVEYADVAQRDVGEKAGHRLTVACGVDGGERAWPAEGAGVSVARVVRPARGALDVLLSWADPNGP
eukprot:CAMPEP_0181237608 /NCGR_PEP_ID=MMETSP1096-20121128/38860_1 /TAXON_ID=156174 ORGANISM="Chrysochromulina ericina, Strain CCMP281" /NCGR_SAMPLE_ID=MMETSP1096 /ASSEMBLY_ACC=CAM_ASM_000453 /LENGTH=141 /DNA_ID=CAMNT_0023332987 /DNA_START=119 /DNA_END=546 /DNA_ORIENTATION=-